MSILCLLYIVHRMIMRFYDSKIHSNISEIHHKRVLSSLTSYGGDEGECLQHIEQKISTF